MANAASKKIEPAYCNGCKGRTAHEVVGTFDGGGSEEDDVCWWDREYSALRCCGCQEVVLRRTIRTEDGEPEVTVFPPVLSRSKPDWRFELPSATRLLLEEIYNSLNSDNVRLPMMGARAVVDMVILEKVGDVGSFREKLKALEKAGYISVQGKEILYAALDLGSAASHRGHAATRRQVQSVMDIVENMLQAVYVFPDVAKKLQEATPTRPPRKTKSPLEKK